MAGYYQYSMSNNAVDAYRRGLLPASKAALAFGFRSAGAVRACVRASEWHHTSKEYNATDFFDVEEAMTDLSWLELAAWKPHLTRKGWSEMKAVLRAKLRRQMEEEVQWRPPAKTRQARLAELALKHPSPYQRRNGLPAVEAAMTGKQLTEDAYLKTRAEVAARRQARELRRVA